MTQNTFEDLEKNIPDSVLTEIKNFEAGMEQYKRFEMAPDRFRSFRLHHGVYGQRQAGVQMIRVKIVSGKVNTVQLRELASIGDDYSRNLAHVTTRQDLQFHFVDLDNVGALMRRLASVGLTTREACGNTVRNVTACPLSGSCCQEPFDVSDVSRQIGNYLLRNGTNQFLPRKFKIAFAGCDRDCVSTPINDIGLKAKMRIVDGKTEYGFQISVGGALGAQPFMAQPLSDFVPMREILPMCEAILLVFERYGNRNNRNKARLKFVIKKMGMDKLRAVIMEGFNHLTSAEPEKYPVVSVKPLDLSMGGSWDGRLAEEVEDSDLKHWITTNVTPQAQRNFYAATIRLILGDITTDQMRALADTAERYGRDEIIFSIDQNVVVPGLHKDYIPDFYEALRAVQLGTPDAGSFGDITSCPGGHTCGLAITTSKGLAEALRDAINKGNGEYSGLEKANIKISGCHNSCGQHHVASLGFHGVVKRIEGKTIPHYQLHLGGAITESGGLIGVTGPKIPARRLPEAVEALVKYFQENKKPNELLYQFYQRVEQKAVAAMLQPYQSIEDYDTNPLHYKDWDQDSDFELLELGPGECASGGIEDAEGAMAEVQTFFLKAGEFFRAGELRTALFYGRRTLVTVMYALDFLQGSAPINDMEAYELFQKHYLEPGLIQQPFDRLWENADKYTAVTPAADEVKSQIVGIQLLLEETRSTINRIKYEAEDNPDFFAYLDTVKPRTTHMIGNIDN